MKKTITLLFGLFFGLNLFGQYVNYETDSRWFLNANVGGTWQTTDVENKTYAGWGLILGKSFNYNYGKFLRWDLRGRYLGGKWYGQDYDSTGLSNYNVVDGAYNPYKDSLGFAVQNFESENHELGLELAVHLNRLRERTGVDLYAFGGANIVWNRTNGDLFDQDTLLGFNNIYNYDAIGLNESSIDDALDGIYDTPLDGHTQKFRANFMPSLGFGIGYYFTPHFSVGLEHKTTFTLLDDWDGFESDVPQGKSDFLNDIYHYTSGYLRFHFRQGRTRPTNLNNNTNNNNLVGGGGCQDPVIAFIQPSQATTDVTVSETQFKVKVSHVVGRENITLRVNGNVTTNFLYNAQSDVLESYLVLAPGMNTIQVTAGNGCGSVSQNYTINYINCIAPEISFTAPSHNNFHANQSQFDIRANIERASNVKFKVNGISTTSFYYNTASGSFQSSVALQPGQNVFELVATNECGTDTETVTVSLSDCNDPSVVFLNSNTHSVTTDVQQFTFKAQVLHVEGRGNIGFRINGVNKQFTFDPDSKYMSSGFTLQEGTNTIQVTAANDCGTETETFTVEYTPCVAPFIQMIDPTGQALQTTASNYIVKAKLFNVESLTQVQLTVNGVLVNGGQFNPSTKVFQKQVSLQMGENVIKLAVTTDCGTDIEVTKVTRVREQSNEMITICHRPPGNPGNGQTITIPLSAWPAHQAHGDVMGPCPEVEEPSNDKITICHRPPGNPENAQTIEIPLSAWPAHQAHGDILGPCPVEEDHSDEKITICHRPPGNPENAQTIEIPLSAWPAHQAHGDVLGPCPTEPTNPGNGGNEKVTICHYPPGNNGNPQTIEIPLSAWPAHQAHGDVMGPCPEEPSNPGNGNEGNPGNPVGNQKITICHYPPGNNGNPQTIEIPLSAWPAHQAHGDKLGPCPEGPGDVGNGNNPNNPGGQIGNPTGTGNGEASGKIKICHYPPGNTDNPQTIEIPLSAWPAHQAHGDVLGPCPEEPNNPGNNGNNGNNGNQGGNNGNSQGTNTNTQGGTGSTGTIGGSGTGSTGTVTGSGSTNTGGTNTNTQGGTGSTGTIGGSGTGSTGTVTGSGNTNTSGTNTNTQGGTGSTGTIGGSGSGSTGTVSGAGSGSGTNTGGGNGSGGGDEGGGNKANTGTSGGKGSGGDNFNGQSSAELKAAQEAAKKKAAEEAAKKKAAEEAAKKRAAEEAAKKKAAEEAAKKKAAEEAAKKKAAEEAAKKKAAEAAAKKKAAEEAAKKKAAEAADKKKAAEEAAKKAAEEEKEKKEEDKPKRP